MDLYQGCSYDAPGVKLGPAPGSQVWNIGTKKENFKILLLWNKKERSFDHLALNYDIWTYINSIHMLHLGSKLAPSRGSWIGTVVIKKVEFILWGNWLRWAIQGHHGPFVFPLTFDFEYIFSFTGCRPASLCHGPLSSVRPSVCVLTFSLNIFSETTHRILMKFHRNVPTMVLFRIS